MSLSRPLYWAQVTMIPRPTTERRLSRNGNRRLLRVRGPAALRMDCLTFVVSISLALSENRRLTLRSSSFLSSIFGFHALFDLSLGNFIHYFYLMHD